MEVQTRSYRTDCEYFSVERGNAFKGQEIDAAFLNWYFNGSVYRINFSEPDEKRNVQAIDTFQQHRKRREWAHRGEMARLKSVLDATELPKIREGVTRLMEKVQANFEAREKQEELIKYEKKHEYRFLIVTQPEIRFNDVDVLTGELYKSYTRSEFENTFCSLELRTHQHHLISPIEARKKKLNDEREAEKKKKKTQLEIVTPQRPPTPIEPAASPVKPKKRNQSKRARKQRKLRFESLL